MTQQEEDEILQGVTPSSERRGALGRLIGGLLNAPAKALGNTGDAITNWFGGTPDPELELPDTMRPHAAEGVAEIGADFTTEIADELIQFFGAGKLLKPVTAGIATKSPLLAEVVKDAAGLALVGGSTSVDASKTLAAEGAAYGLTSGLPRLARIPLSAATALIGRYFQNESNPEELVAGMTQGDLNAAIGFGTSLLPGQKSLISSALRNVDVAPASASASKLAITNGSSSSPILLTDRALEGQIIEPFDAARMLRGGPNEIVDGVVNAGYTTPEEIALLNYFRTKPLELPAPRVPSVSDLQSSIPESTSPIGMGYWTDRVFDNPVSRIDESLNYPSTGFANLAKPIQQTEEQAPDPQLLLNYFRNKPLELPAPRVPSMQDIASRIPKRRDVVFSGNITDDIWQNPLAPIKGIDNKTDFTKINDRLNTSAKVALARMSDNVEASPLRQKSKMKTRPSWTESEGGFVMPELNAAVARMALGSAVGAGIGATMDDGNSNENLLLNAAAMGAALAFGPAIAGKALKVLSQTKMPVKPQPLNSFVKSWGQKIEEMAGKGLTGSNPHATDRFVRMLDTQFGLTLAPEIKATLLKSRGVVDFHINLIDSALREVGLNFKPTPALKNLTEQFMSNPSNQSTFIQNASQLDPQGKAYANMIVIASESISALQRMALKGISDPKQAAVMANSIGTYFTRSYKLFTSDWTPDAKTIDNLIAKIKSDGVFPGASDNTIRQHLNGYLTEVRMNKGAYGVLSPASQKISQTAFTHRKNMSKEWLDFLGEIDNPAERILHTTFRLRSMAEAGENFANLAKLDIDGITPAVFDSYGSLDAFRTKLKVDLDTKLQQAANLRLQANQAASNGNSQLASNLIEQAKSLDLERTTMSKHLTSLDSYHQLGDGLSNGSLAGKVVSRGVLDSVKGVQDLNKIHHPFVRAMSRFNSFIKAGHTIYNPVTTVRNYLNAAAMSGIARVDMSDIPEAFRTVLSPKHPLNKELYEQGIKNADAVHGELIKDYNQYSANNSNMFNDPLSAMLGMSKLDSGSVRKVTGTIASIYSLPDVVVRTAAYISAKRRFAAKLNLPESDAKVIEKAREFTERYTMNYSAVAPFVKTARNIPMTNLFLSYTAEMGRVGKNLIEDVLKGSDGFSHSRLYASGVLGTIVAAPAMYASSSESNLSAKDRKDWEKTKSLMPNYMKDQYKIISGRRPDGTFVYSDISPLVPSDAYNKMFANIAKGDLQAAAESNPFVSLQNSPILNLVGSVILGQDYKTHKEFRGFGDIVAMAAREILPPIFPTGTEFQKLKTAHTLNDRGQLGVTDQFGSRLTPSEVWQPYYTGLRVGQVNLNKMQKIAIAKSKNAIADEVGYLRKVLSSDVNQSVKDAANKRAQQSIKLIQATLRLQLEDQDK